MPRDIGQDIGQVHLTEQTTQAVKPSPEPLQPAVNTLARHAMTACNYRRCGAPASRPANPATMLRLPSRAIGYFPR